MRANKPPARRNPRIIRELAGHAAMGAALGLAFSFAMLLNDAFGLRTLISHGADARTITVIFVGTFTVALAVGATLTGFVFTMMEER
jgi:hypothetical protein